ncbi:MAG: UvrD-helicase domain-containing protein [Chloroflexi bacterium]|nr:UvrD-helicase domain-containing protein [Chloroflexota bacterium]
MSEFNPTDEQRLALEHPAPLLALAGAGTGKTTVLTRRIARMILEAKARPDQIVALTFTDKAAAEMAERLTEILAEVGRAEAAHEVTVATFHSFGGMIVRENLMHLGFDRLPAVLSGPGAWQLLASIFDDLTFDAIEISTGAIAGVFNHLLHFFSQCKDHLVTPDDLDHFVEGYGLAALPSVAAVHMTGRLAQVRELAAAYRRFEAAKQAKNLVDFGDHLLLPVQLFAAQPEVRDAYRRRFPSVFVDEYQDTNYAQRVLLLDLLDPAHPEIVVIGDDDQAIYRWRGGVVHNILRFPEEPIFTAGQVKVAPMTMNRRSFPPILDLANLVLSEIGERHDKRLGYHPDVREERATLGRFVAGSDRQEGKWIAAKIAEMEPAARQLAEKKKGYGAFAVLCRKRSLFEPVGKALETAGIPYELLGGTGFYGRWEIRDILSYLRLLADPADGLALARILMSPRFRLGGRDIFHLAQWVRRKNGDRGRDGEVTEGAARYHLFDAVLRHEGVDGLSASARQRLGPLGEELRGYAEKRQSLSLGALVTQVIDLAGYRRELLAQSGFDAKAAVLNLAKLEELARQFEAQSSSPAGRAELAGFVEFVGYATESGEEEGEVLPVDEETPTVKVMTIHQAKGLEFPFVFVPGLAERIFPLSGRDETDKWWDLPWDLRGDRQHLPSIDLRKVQTRADLDRAQAMRKEAEKALRLDEERRLLYVAITRAQQHLYLSRAHWYGTTAKPRPPSRFWDAIAGSDFVEDLGGEECPATNPNLALAAAGHRQSADGTAEEALSALPLGEQFDRSGVVGVGANGRSPLHTGKTDLEVGDEREASFSVEQGEVDSHIESLIYHSSAEDSPLEPVPRTSITCSALAHYLACPRGYRFVYVDRLPTRPSPRLALGIEVHRRIEDLSRPRQAIPQEPIDEDGPDEDELASAESRAADLVYPVGDWVDAEELVRRYEASAYARRPATFVEESFQLSLGPATLRGRINRLDNLPDGSWELVDFKSGAASPNALAFYRPQIALYALAVREVWQVPAERIAAHILFLQDGEDTSLTFDEAAFGRIRSEAEEATQGILNGKFPKTIDKHLCERCSYVHLCARLDPTLRGCYH